MRAGSQSGAALMLVFVQISHPQAARHAKPVSLSQKCHWHDAECRRLHVGDRPAAKAAYTKTEEKTAGVGQKMDLAFSMLRCDVCGVSLIVKGQTLPVSQDCVMTT